MLNPQNLHRILRMPDSQVNVLLVDDHPENLIALEAVLGDLGQNLVRAHSGEEALKCLLNQDFAVILLDVQMPGIDGFETATLIRQRDRSRHTPIIFLTAFSTSDTLMFKGYSLGAVDYLLKPIDPTILCSKVSVFVDLYKKTAEVQRQAAQLTAVNAELRKSEEKFRSLSACSPVGIFLADTNGDCTYTNPRCQTICGFTLEESLRDGWLQFVHPDDRPAMIADWKAYTLEGRSFARELRFQRRDGTVFWTNLYASPMFSDYGQPLGHVGTVEDITERKLAEEARTRFIQEQAARQEAEAANRMKDEFLAVLSHELRTPLNSILGWAKLLLSREFDPTTTIRALETIERNAKSQAQLIEDILDVSHIIQGKLRLQIRPTNPALLVDLVLETLKLSAEAKSINLVTDVDPHLETIAADPERLRQVIGNLVSNAIKFTPEGGQVTIGARLRPPAHANGTGTDTPACVEIRVSDTGIGIKPDFLPYVFDRFRQADSTSTRSYGGLGLGLAIAHHLVTLHHGTIEATSEGEGQGATFTITVPLWREGDWIPEENPQTSLSEIAVPHLASLSILVVEDHKDTRDFIVALLRQAGAEVTAVSSVKAAIAALEQHPFEVILSDMGLPEASSYDLIRCIKQVESKQGKPIRSIALTTYTQQEECEKAIAAGFQAHLSKPVEPTHLLKAIADLANAAVKEIAH